MHLKQPVDDEDWKGDVDGHDASPPHVRVDLTSFPTREDGKSTAVRNDGIWEEDLYHLTRCSWGRFLLQSYLRRGHFVVVWSILFVGTAAVVLCCVFSRYFSTSSCLLTYVSGCCLRIVGYYHGGND